MKSVFEASTGLDAHMILNLLEQRGISGRIEGEYLQGGIGELAAMVAEEKYAEARQIIGDWEAIQPPEEKSQPETSTSIALRIFISGVFVGMLVMYLLFKIFAA
jgi:hypothetical protein